MITVPKKVSLTNLFGGRKADPVVPHTTSSGQPILDITETMKSFTKADDTKPTWGELWQKTPILGERPKAENSRYQRYFDEFSKDKLTERINMRKSASESEINNTFLNTVVDLAQQPQPRGKGVVQTKYSDDLIQNWIEINKGTANREFIKKNLKKILPDMDIVQTLDKRAKELVPNWEFNKDYISFWQKKPIHDSAIMEGLKNLSDYSWKQKTTGRELHGQDLKNVMWPNNPEYHNLWKGDDFAGMVREVIRKNYSHLFPADFKQYSSPTQRKTPLKEQVNILENKNFSEIAPIIIKEKGKIPEQYRFVDNFEIMGSANTQIVSDAIGKVHNASKAMEDMHPSVNRKINRQVSSLINRYLMEGFKQNKKATINSMMKDVNAKMNNPDFAKGFADLLNKRAYYDEYLEMAKKMTGVEDVSDIKLSDLPASLQIAHKTALRDYYKLGVEIDNLFLLGGKANQASTIGMKITDLQKALKKTKHPGKRAELQSQINSYVQQGQEKGIIGDFGNISIGKVKDDLKILTGRMEDHFYQVMGKNRGGLVKPHMAYGGDMAQFTDMESVVPDLNPAEAGMEGYTQLAMSIPKFRNPFKKVDPPPIMSDATSGIKITDKTK